MTDQQVEPSLDERQKLMNAFKRAFGKADRDAFAKVVTDDFKWHMHWYLPDDPQPTGNVVTGPDAAMAEVAWRAANWSDVRFDDVEERFIDDLIVQTFRISGTDHAGESFEVDAVDLYRIVDGQLALKDTYWKRPAIAGEER
ncbi:MAG: nuclear transport factor 2 family protein [Acidimicrobiales bacterium]